MDRETYHCPSPKLRAHGSCGFLGVLSGAGVRNGLVGEGCLRKEAKKQRRGEARETQGIAVGKGIQGDKIRDAP